MNEKIVRRRFLQGAAASALAGVAATRAAASPQAENGSVPGAKMPRMFSGCCAYSYRKYLQHGPMSMEEFILKAVELRLDGVDMTGYYFDSLQPGYLEGLRHFAYKHGVPFSGAACGVSLVQRDAHTFVDQVPEITRWVDATDRLGASHLRVFAGKLPAGLTKQQAIAEVVDQLKRGSDYSAKRGVMLGLEDHSGITQDADTCLEIMQRVNSPYVGINLDITNFIPTATQDAYAQIEACIPYATNTHIRDVFDDQTPIDMDRVWGMFARAGFKGYMSAEYEGREDPMTGVPKLIAKIQALCKKYSTV